MIAPHQHKESVVVMPVVEEDNHWRNIGLGIVVGSCDSLGEGLRVAVLGMKMLV